MGDLVGNEGTQLSLNSGEPLIIPLGMGNENMAGQKESPVLVVHPEEDNVPKNSQNLDESNISEIDTSSKNRKKESSAEIIMPHEGKKKLESESDAKEVLSEADHAEDNLNEDQENDLPRVNNELQPIERWNFTPVRMDEKANTGTAQKIINRITQFAGTTIGKANRFADLTDHRFFTWQSQGQILAEKG